ncbi:MAG: DUF4263 domain-containing protein [Verrucomicrobiales bacterium]
MMRRHTRTPHSRALDVEGLIQCASAPSNGRRKCPRFTALRHTTNATDVVELKQPFLRLFRSDGSLSATFNDAWNQAERYLDFCQRQRTYLMDQKQLRFENSRCILLIGHDLTIPQSDAIRSKESMSRLITVMTYDQLYRHARHFFDVVVAAEDRTYPSEQIGG